MATVGEWIALLSAEVGRGIYVWGGNGQCLDKMTDPENWIAAKETTARNAARAIALYRKRVKAGVTEIRAFDCSGLMHYGLKTLHILEKDVSARGLYALCIPLADKSDLTAGDFVFRHDGTRIVHVGAYLGSGTVIECLGRDDGVVRTALSKGNWNRFGRLKEWTDADGAMPEGRTVRIKGNSVRVRSGGSTAYPTLCVAHRGDTFPLCGSAESGWHRIVLSNGQDGFVTNKPRYTEVIDHG